MKTTQSIDFRTKVFGGAPVDRAGNPTTIDGDVRFQNSDEAKMRVERLGPAEFMVTPLGPLGNARLTLTADVRMGPDVKEKSDFVDFTFIAGEAVGLGLNVSPPEEIPES